MRRFNLQVVAIFVAALAMTGWRSSSVANPPEEKQPAKKVAHRVVRVSDADARRPAEVSVAINPTNPDHVLAVSIQAGKAGAPLSNHVYVSTDGGQVWKTVAAPNPDHRTQGDDAIAFGPDGVAHRTYIAFEGIRKAKPVKINSGIYTSSSRDGLAWTKPVPIVDHINSIEPFEDKPYLAIDTSADSPHRGNFYVAWTKFDVYGSKAPEHKTHIYLARSKDGGKNFAPPVRVSDKPGGCLDDSSTVEGAVPAVGPKGEVYLAWAGPEGIVFTQSTDGGWSFAKNQVIAKNHGGWDIPAKGLRGHNGMPVTACDISKGKDRGSIYVSWIDTRHGDPDVFLIASRDNGKTWSEPLRVNDDDKGNGKEQLFAWMAVDPVDGAVNLVFYDRRNLKDTMTGLTLARSTDGGLTFLNHPIDQEPFATHADVFFGDYIGLAAYDGRVIAVYMHFIAREQLALSAAIFRFQPGR